MVLKTEQEEGRPAIHEEAEPSMYELAQSALENVGIDPFNPEGLEHGEPAQEPLRVVINLPHLEDGETRTTNPAAD